MIGDLIKILTALGAAAIAVQVGTKLATGRWAHEILFEWWGRMRDRIQSWLNRHQELGITQIAFVMLDRFDQVVCHGKRLADRVTLSARAQTAAGKTHIITEEEISFDEAVKQFPGIGTTGACSYAV